MKLFFDRCMPIKLCRMVVALDYGGHHLVHHDDDGRFDQSTQDIEWIHALAGDAVRPVVISGDHKILKRPDEVAALQASSLTFFCFTGNWMNLPIEEQAWKFVKIWPEIIKKAAVREATVFEINGNMKIEKNCLTKHIRK
jgi:hypothetical protein